MTEPAAKGHTQEVLAGLTVTVDLAAAVQDAATLGPFQILDITGLITPYNILAGGNTGMQQLGAWLKAEYIDKGRLGVATGGGSIVAHDVAVQPDGAPCSRRSTSGPGAVAAEASATRRTCRFGCGQG